MTILISAAASGNACKSCKCAALALSRVRCWIISITAAASGHACKSVLNPYASKDKVKKIRVKDSVCIGEIREFFLTFVL